jgi:hypothetical protein
MSMGSPSYRMFYLSSDLFRPFRVTTIVNRNAHKCNIAYINTHDDYTVQYLYDDIDIRNATYVRLTLAKFQNI